MMYISELLRNVYKIFLKRIETINFKGNENFDVIASEKTKTYKI